MISVKFLALIVGVLYIGDVSGFGAWRQTTGRIVGGIETSIERRPYQVSLQYDYGVIVFHTCGASIISTKFLLSAAHCNPGGNAMFARVGSTSYLEGGQVLRIAKFTPHERYESTFLDYDFAVLSFQPGQEIILKPNVAIIPLAEPETDPLDGTMVTASGWGATTDSSGSPIKLREADLPMVERNRCLKIYGFLSMRQLCLGGTKEGNLNVCFGDSGGPAVQNGRQYGVASAVSSAGCQAPNYPGIFSRVSAVRDWINNLTGV